MQLQGVNKRRVLRVIGLRLGDVEVRSIRLKQFESVGTVDVRMTSEDTYDSRRHPLPLQSHYSTTDGSSKESLQYRRVGQLQQFNVHISSETRYPLYLVNRSGPRSLSVSQILVLSSTSVVRSRDTEHWDKLQSPKPTVFPNRDQEPGPQKAHSTKL